jgi:hypothetical protein
VTDSMAAAASAALPASAAPFAADRPTAPAPEPLRVRPVETGHAEVDAVLARLEAMEGTPTDAHVVVYEDVHQRLRDTLTALDNRPGPPPPAAAAVPGPAQRSRS